MMKTIKSLLIPISLLVIVGFVLFVVNQIAGVYLLIRSSSEIAAEIVLGLLIMMAFILFAWPVLLYLRLPRPLVSPTDQKDLPAYREKLLRRLRKNTLLKKERIVLHSVDDLPAALKVLETEAKKVVHQTASAVFLTTAISQNGKLDALTVLATQSRMVWKVAHIYFQRPALRELIYLYANVGASSFLASRIEEIDLSQQIEPVIRSFMKNSASKSLPIIGPTANLIMDSLVEGSTNAFLTLRVGNICIRYCGCNEVLNKKALTMRAFKESAGQLRELVLKSSGEIISALLKASRKAGMDTLKSGWEGIKRSGTRAIGKLGQTSHKMGLFKKKSGKEGPSIPVSD